MKKTPSFLSLCTALLGLIYGIFIFSNYLHYGAEGIFYDGLRRVLSGQAFISLWNEIPVSLSVYFPTTYILYYPWAKVFGTNEPQSLAFMVRIISPLYFIFYLYLFRKIISHANPSKMDLKFLLLGILFFLFKEFTGIFCFKPDTHGLVWEMIGFGLVLAWGNKRQMTFLILSAVIFAAAAVIKLNMIGIGAGAGLGLLFSKEYKAFAIFTVVGCISLAIFLFGVHFYIGEEHFQTILRSTRSDLYAFSKLSNIVSRTLFQIAIPYLCFFYLAWKSLFSSKTWNPVQKKMISISLFLSTSLALLGQFKFGAETNYFYDMAFLSIVIAAFSISSLKPGKQKIFFQLGKVLVVLAAIRCVFLPAQIIANDLKNYDYSAAIEYLDETFENPRIYTENNNAAVHLGQRSLLSAGFFNIYRATSSIKKLGPEIVDRIIQSGGVDAFFVAGSGCKTFKARHPFNGLTLELTHLSYQKGKICIFTKKP